MSRKVEIKEVIINGWKYYRNQTHGKMVAYYPNVEQIIFETDEAFNSWLEAEKKEQG